MKAEAPGSLTNGQLLVTKDKQPWKLGVICLKDDKDNTENVSNMS